MNKNRLKRFTGPLLAGLILLSGLAFIPFTSISADELGWQQLAGAYLPTLNIIEDKGQPGSAYIFNAAGYPPNATATIYVETNLRGWVTTDASGNATFAIQSATADPLGRYDVTMTTDANNSATDDVRLEADRPLLTLPPGFPHPVFDLFGPPPPSGNDIFVSAGSSGSTGDGLSYGPEDVLSHNSGSWSWSMVFSSPLGGDIDAYTRLDNGMQFFSLAQDTSTGGGSIDNSDLILVRPNGSLKLGFDGSDVGLDTATENLDAAAFTPDGKLVISTRGAFSVPQTGGGDLTGGGEDLIQLDNGRLGGNTQGTWSMYFDGSDAGLTTENIDAVWIGDADIYFSTFRRFNAGGTPAEGSDVIACLGATTGDTSACSSTFVLWSGGDAGLGSRSVDALYIEWAGVAQKAAPGLLEGLESLDTPDLVIGPAISQVSTHKEQCRFDA